MTKGAGKILGWNLSLSVLNFLGLLFIFILIFSFDRAESFRILIRFTARLSLVLFSMAFVASSAFYLWPKSRFFRWLAQNRRHLGISFAISHLFHLAGIVGLGFLDTANFFETTPWTTFVFGGLVYIFIVFMLITSFDRPAAWISTHQWNLGHKIGSYGIWFIFMVSYFGRVAAMQWIYIVPAILILSTVIIRYKAWKKRKLSDKFK